jgi:putative transposase
MARKTKPVVLLDGEKDELSLLIKKGTHKSRKITRAKVLLLLHEGKSRTQIQAELSISSNHFTRLKNVTSPRVLPELWKRCPAVGNPPKVTPNLEAHITSLACSEAPAGSARWTLSLINEKIVELKYVDSISNESIRGVLKKANSNPGSSKCGASAVSTANI